MKGREFGSIPDKPDNSTEKLREPRGRSLDAGDITQPLPPKDSEVRALDSLTAETFSGIVRKVQQITEDGRNISAGDRLEFSNAVEAGLLPRNALVGKEHPGYGYVDNETGIVTKITAAVFHEVATKADKLPDGGDRLGTVEIDIYEDTKLGSQANTQRSGAYVSTYFSSKGEVHYDVHYSRKGADSEINALVEENYAQFGIPVQLGEKDTAKPSRGTLYEQQGTSLQRSLGEHLDRFKKSDSDVVDAEVKD